MPTSIMSNKPYNSTYITTRFARSKRLANALHISSDALRICTRALSPWFDLALRLWLAQIFWLSGLVKIASWDTALTLATYEYPVSWLNPVSAAYLGAAIEIVCPLFLAFGLATRLAALPLLFLSLVIQFEYQMLNEHLYWAILFSWFVVFGAGPLSLDRLIAPGLATSALPFARAASAWLRALTRTLGPVYRLALRLVLALVFAIAGLALVEPDTHGLFHYRFQVPLLPPASAPYWTALLTLVCPVLLGLGFATRLAALTVLFILSGAGMIMDIPALARIDYFYWSLLLLLLLLHGPGSLSLDYWLGRHFQRWLAQLGEKLAMPLAALPQVLIVGAGFGGLAAARALRLAPCRVTLVDRHNYHLFQPLLYQVATASLSPADIAVPVRELFREQTNVRVLLGTVSGVDTGRQCVFVGERQLPYDYLILSTGARHAYFGRDEWEMLAPGLKQIDDATYIRRRLLLAFEQAENTDDSQQRQRWLTFVIVGAGPTGVELAGAIAELARHGMTDEFRQIDPARARVLLVQSGPRVLPTFAETLSAAAAGSLRALSVEVLTNSRVEQVDDDGVMVSGRRIEAGTVFWAAGVVASPAAKWVGGECDSAGRLKVGPDLSVPGLSNVFAIGDTAYALSWGDQPVPGLAPAAKQGGQYVAKVIRARLLGRSAPTPFRYRHLGSLATIGRKAAVADFGWIRLAGASAWWLWGAVHILFLAGMRSRLLVALQWLWAYLTFRRGTRLITGDSDTDTNVEQTKRDVSPAPASLSLVHGAD